MLARGAVRERSARRRPDRAGNGDPSVSAHMQKGDALAPLRALADSLRAHGIHAHARDVSSPHHRHS